MRNRCVGAALALFVFGACSATPDAEALVARRAMLGATPLGAKSEVLKGLLASADAALKDAGEKRIAAAGHSDDARAASEVAMRESLRTADRSLAAARDWVGAPYGSFDVDALRTEATVLTERANKEKERLTKTEGADPDRIDAFRRVELHATYANQALVTGAENVDRAVENLRTAGATMQDAQNESEQEIRYSPYFRVHAGAATVSPTILKRRASDSLWQRESRTTTDFYAEVDYMARTAWVEPKDLGDLKRVDYELRLGFVNSEAIENSTRAANGDWYVDASVGIVLYRFSHWSRNAAIARGTLNLELNGGLVTNRSALDSVGYYQLGVGSAWAVPVTLDTTSRFGTLFAGFYYGVHEYPAVDSDGVARSDRDLPRYTRLGSLGAKFDIAIPLTGRIDAVIQTRWSSPIADDDTPDDWSLFVGASIPLGRLLRDLTGEDK